MLTMIISILLIAMALFWLLNETNYLTVCLQVGKDKPITPEPEKPSMEMKQVKTDDTNYIPSEFIPLDMPVSSGTVNVKFFRICES